MAARWKQDRKRLERVRAGFWEEMRRLNIRNRDGSRPAIAGQRPVRSYREWEKWMRRCGGAIGSGERQ